MIKIKNYPVFFSIFIVGLIASLFYGMLYQIDNKYNTAIPTSQDGVLLLPDMENANDPHKDDLFWMIQGWDFYPDQLLTPNEQNGEAISLYIGQYSNFSKLYASGSPYGTGTYAIKIRGNGNYTMWIPEAASAAVVYVDGQLVTSSGSISPYEPYIKDLIFSFKINGEAQIVIQTANYTHYYAGITYPPVIANSETISRLFNIRMLFYGFLVFTSLSLTLFATVIWWNYKKSRIGNEDFWLGLLAVSFALRVCYPFIHILGISGGELPYILENTMAALGIFCIVRTVSLLCLSKDSIFDRILKGLSGSFVCIAFLFSFWMTDHLPGFVPLYGQILYWYKAVVAITMLFLLLHQLLNRPSKQTFLLLAGLFVYSLSLLFHALYLGSYEPIYTGWFEEWGTYLLILCFAARMLMKNIEIIRENHYLNEHLQEEVTQKTQSISKLLEERKLLLSELTHDLKTPMTSIITFTRLVELDNTHLDDESKQYLNIIRQKTKEMQEQLQTVNEWTQMDLSTSSIQPFDLTLLIRDFCKDIQADMDVNSLVLRLFIKADSPVLIHGNQQKMISVLQNLVFNAVSFTPAGGTITLSLQKDDTSVLLQVEDNGAGIAQEDLPHIFDRFFSKRKNGKNNGMGLFIVKSIIAQHNGTIEATSQLEKGTTFTIRLPLDHY